MFRDIPRAIDSKGLEKDIRNIKAWSKDCLDELTLEAAAEAINVLLDKIWTVGEFVENSHREQRETITRLEEQIKDAEKDKRFLKDIIMALIERRY